MESPILKTKSIVAGRDFTPQVQFEWGEMRFQLSPNEARDLAARIWQAAEAAESDSFLVNFLKENLPMADGPVLAGFLGEFREYREKRARLDYLPR